MWIEKVKSSLKLKLILMVLTLIISVVSLIGFFNYNVSSDTINHDVELFSNEILKQANLHVSQYLKEYEYTCLLIGASAEFQHWLAADPKDKYEQLHWQNQIENKYVFPMSTQYPEILSVTLFNYNGVERDFQVSTMLLHPNYAVHSEPWFDQVVPSIGLQFFVDQGKNYENPELFESKLPVITMVKRFEYKSNSGLIKLDISASRAVQILSQIDLGLDSMAFLADQAGQPIIGMKLQDNKLAPATRERIALSPKGSYYDRKTNEMIMFQTLQYTGWKSVVIVPYEKVAEGILKLRSFTIWITVITLVCAFIIILWISSSITGRIRLLSQSIKQIQLNTLGQRVAIQGTDEVAELGDAYNQMLHELSLSLKMLTETRTHQQQAFMSALQSQINSHFIYNALESINAMANIIQHEPIMRMAIALSDMLRYTSNYRRETVSLRDELKHVQNYLDIVNSVYGDRVQVDIRLSGDVLDFPCLKACLQPIVENCIRHGFEKTGRSMDIVIEAKLDRSDYVSVTISDNGAGFTEEKLMELCAKMESAENAGELRDILHVGLMNVHYRLRVFYKDRYAGVHLGNDPLTGGAMVRIVFPVGKLEQRIKESEL